MRNEEWEMRKSIYVILRSLVAAYNRYTRMASWGKYKYIDVEYLDYLLLYCLRHREIKYDPDVVW